MVDAERAGSQEEWRTESPWMWSCGGGSRHLDSQHCLFTLIFHLRNLGSVLLQGYSESHRVDFISFPEASDFTKPVHNFEFG